jgi:hypothetical protein
MVRHFSFSRSDMSNGNGAPPAMSDLKAPTYKIQTLTVRINKCHSPWVFPSVRRAVRAA